MSKKIPKNMHPRNIFRTPPDYTALAIKHQDFRKVCKLELSGKVSIDYKQEYSLRALTQMLLREHFHLNVEFAPGSLVPTLPLRLNYILWLEDLVDALNVEQVRGIDIGCGSSCIYSLLAAKKNNWQMAALESNTSNLKYAEDNIVTNELQKLIKLFPQNNKNVIFKDFFESTPSNEDSTYHFCLCNPPFYDSSLADPFNGNTRKRKKRAPPHNCHTGQAEELACDGGEVQFVQRIIEESLLYNERISIFTTMLGHKSSVTKIIEILRSHDIVNNCTTEFCQGNTTRWGVAWSFKVDIKLAVITTKTEKCDATPKQIVKDK